MKRIFAVTHGLKLAGANPRLDTKGEADIIAIACRVPTDIKSVWVGTGARFIHTFDTLRQTASLACVLDRLDEKYCPLLGGPDSGKRAETGWDVILADGTEIKAGDYQGLIDVPGIDLWKFLESLPNNTLLVTGREFVGVLVGSADNAKSSTVYEIIVDPAQGKVSEITS